MKNTFPVLIIIALVVLITLAVMIYRTSQKNNIDNLSKAIIKATEDLSQMGEIPPAPAPDTGEEEEKEPFEDAEEIPANKNSQQPVKEAV